MTLRDYIKQKCIEVDIENMVSNGFRTEKEIRNWYEQQTDLILVKIYDEYFELGTLLDINM